MRFIILVIVKNYSSHNYTKTIYIESRSPSSSRVSVCSYNSVNDMLFKAQCHSGSKWMPLPSNRQTDRMLQYCWLITMIRRSACFTTNPFISYQWLTAFLLWVQCTELNLPFEWIQSLLRFDSVISFNIRWYFEIWPKFCLSNIFMTKSSVVLAVVSSLFKWRKLFCKI